MVNLMYQLKMSFNCVWKTVAKKRYYAILLLILILSLAGCTSKNTDKGYISVNALYENLNQKPDEIINSDPYTSIFTNVCGIVNPSDKSMSFILKDWDKENPKSIEVYFEQEAPYDAFRKKYKNGDSINLTGKVFADDSGTPYIIYTTE